MPTSVGGFVSLLFVLLTVLYAVRQWYTMFVFDNTNFRSYDMFNDVRGLNISMAQYNESLNFAVGAYNYRHKRLDPLDNPYYSIKAKLFTTKGDMFRGKTSKEVKLKMC